MALNYRVGTIIIAAIIVIGTIFDSVQLFFPTDGRTNYYTYLDNVRLHQGLTIVANIISLVTVSCLYAVISIDIETNVRRKKFLLPFILWATVLCVWRLTAFTVLLTKFGSKIDKVTYTMWLGGAVMLFLSACLEISYYRLLSHDNGAKLDSKHLVLKESSYQWRKYELGPLGRVYYNDDEEVVAGEKKKKKKSDDDNNNKDFLSSKLNAMNKNMFIIP